MSGDSNSSGSRAREIELALIERIDGRLDSLVEDVRDVRERVIRMEAQDPAVKINTIEVRVRGLEEWKARVSGQVALIIVPVAAFIGAVAKAIIDVITR